MAKEQALTKADIMALPTLDVDYANKQGETNTYTGVLISELLKLAEPDAAAATLVFVASDGYTAEIALADVMACKNCILAFMDEGGLLSVLPDQSGKLQVRDLVELQVK